MLGDRLLAGAEEEVRSRGATEIVLHEAVQGSYSGCISWFQNSSASVSASAAKRMKSCRRPIHTPCD